MNKNGCLQPGASVDVTTDSTHGLPRFPNLIKELIPTRPNQLWVSDITYIPIWVDDNTYIFCFLSLILDAYTEEIVGWSVGPTLETVYPAEALKMALKRLEGLEKIDLIHHSDRGVQYASSEYIRLLKEHGICISMTETGDHKENAQAERINNTMKNELLKGKHFTDIAQVRSAVAKAVDFYNSHRPHMSINMMNPAKAAFCEGVLEKWWVSYREKAVRAIYNELPITFETGEGVEIAKSHKVSERTFKDWLKSDFFRHIKHGTYEKKYK